VSGVEEEKRTDLERSVDFSQEDDIRILSLNGIDGNSPELLGRSGVTPGRELSVPVLLDFIVEDEISDVATNGVSH